MRDVLQDLDPDRAQTVQPFVLRRTAELNYIVILAAEIDAEFAPVLQA